MIIGLQNGIVLQRNHAGVCETTIYTEATGLPVVSAVGPYGVSCSVSLCEVEGNNNWRKFQLTGLHTGGPHKIWLEIGNEVITYTDIYVGDVWLLGGQSNMEGAGVYRDAAASIAYNPCIRYCTTSGIWNPAGLQTHQNYSSLEPMILKHLAQSESRLSYYEPNCVGPGYFFAQEMYNRTGVPQGLIPAALGGSCLKQWNPVVYEEDSPNLYHIAIRKCKQAGGNIKGVFWYQGCSEGNAEDASLFTERMKYLIACFRRDLQKPELPFVQVQIASYAWSDAANDMIWSSIREQQRTLGEQVDYLDTVAVTNAILADGIHLSSDSQRYLGIRAAESMFHLCFDPYGTESTAAPALDSIFLVSSLDSGFSTLGVRYRNIHGTLQSKDPATGFSFWSKDDPRDLRGIIRVDLYDDTAYIRHIHSPEVLRDSYLYYYFGNATYANITDGTGRPLPAFGPICPLSDCV